MVLHMRRQSIFILLVPMLLISLGAASLAGESSSARAPGKGKDKEKVENFALIDHRGEFHELYYHEKDPETRAIALIVHGNGCPIVRQWIPELNRLHAVYGKQGIRFWMINSNPQDSREEVKAEADSFQLAMPVLLDPTQLVAGALGIERTAEAILIDPATWKIQYRGAIGDRFDYESTKPKDHHEYLAEALDAMLEGKPIPTQRTTFSGCRVSRLAGTEKDLPADAYSKTVAPLLIDRCVRCHREGGIGPFAMSNYKKVQGWSEMMEEVLMTRRMPPWQADPHMGTFENDGSLSEVQAVTLVRWLRAGAPRGKGPDPLAAHRPSQVDWVLGQPDHVMEIERQEVPAEGVLEYRYVHIPSPFPEDVWIRAVDVRPGNTRVLHHIIASSYLTNKDGEKKDIRSLAGYAPGMGVDVFPEGTAVLLKANSTIEFQLHYTVSGKPETDATRLGIYLSKEPPQKELRSGVVIHTKFKIPPGDRSFTVCKTNTFDRDVRLFSMNPHMHYRGKSMRYEAHYPNGRQEVLLSTPNYHFNWQRSYQFAEPKLLPAGTKLVVYATWDNSTLNPSNPDPAREVPWGEQTFDEMFFASYRYIHAGPKVTAAAAPSPAQAE